MKKKRQKFSKVIPLFFILLFGLLILYLSYEKNCEYSKECFDEAFNQCNKAKYLSNEDGNIFEYKIKGKKGNECILNVRVIEVGQDADQEIKELFRGKSMICKVSTNQEFTLDTLSFCTGPLKESMYEMIIQKMYNILAQNLGDVIYQLQE